MDTSLVSMRDLFLRLNSRNIDIDISTFSKANKHRSSEAFEKILNKGLDKLNKKKGKSNNKILFPLDSKIVTLTSKLLWSEGYHQVKLFAGINSWTNEVGGISIHFGQGHDSKYGNKTINLGGFNHYNKLVQSELEDKKFSSSAPYSEINEMVLSMVLATTQITPQTVFEAMTAINTSTLKEWIKEVFGESMIAKRKAVFSDL